MTKYYSWGVNGFPPYVFDTIWKRWKLNGRGGGYRVRHPGRHDRRGQSGKAAAAQKPQDRDGISD
ncbi:TPA: hypothetical protein WGW93_001467 [Neisseria meningitidis]|uniref:Uncharacterized protein n=1 Tax=Neisseria meningitidis TaxID=487 RepID=A0AAD2J7R3_NEIME|nr:hypothetical protein [Neisseria meningitidis]ADY96988.1 hypothetical protein NMBM01240149_0366 [Neisseria meningitidis M01-240149]AKM92822.1 hypothetical protein M0579_01348 [Neisseria meningitidis M0579]EGC52385.1 hypothetical protein NMBOX9930304_1657 [Neisseria meningitidis OX99.30304]EGC64087.1 hypothetical protein NMB9615945_1765 [Neisseria meningitidis 961-5945]ELK74131.1 hypothetical protein NM2006087_0663 [Neisseria meningitidis 2006087]ELK75495.1 hypothetical protein NM2002038_161